MSLKIKKKIDNEENDIYPARVFDMNQPMMVSHIEVEYRCRKVKKKKKKLCDIFKKIFKGNIPKDFIKKCHDKSYKWMK